MHHPIRRIALTPGEPAGIGPDLIAAIAASPSPIERVVIADRDMLCARATALGHDLAPYPFDPTASRARRPRARSHWITSRAAPPSKRASSIRATPATYSTRSPAPWMAVSMGVSPPW